ncbi:hypothetical protein Scep_000611 [Stephania cephalantha]|uniref:rRNA adenine N(6)-methyltransferase n=1 Tax=Stephania cephalantha TaxID=152367 RepID=A0AAP0L958_9MAGN
MNEASGRSRYLQRCFEGMRTFLDLIQLWLIFLMGYLPLSIAKFVLGTNSFRSATLLFQKEFACRLLANPGDSQFNCLVVNVKLVADIEFIMDVSKRDFIPCPKVDSSDVKIYPKVNVPSVDMNEWWAFTRTCFSKKNKTLGATFKQKKKAYELLRRSEMVDKHKDKVLTNCMYDDETNKSNDEEEVDEEHLGDEFV